MKHDEVQVLIVDDQLPFREASRMVVEMTDGFDVAGEAETVSKRWSWWPSCDPIWC
ncbi:MAG: hypothetical protein ACXWH0_08335 [Acidimicrobiia bacterium]